MAEPVGKQVLASALPWLITGGAILLLIYLFRKEIGAGGLQDWFRKLLGLGAPDPIASQEETQQDSFGEDHDSSGVGAQAVTGHFAIKSGDTIQLVNELNLTTRADVPLNLVNSSPKPQKVEVKLNAYVDYTFSDESLTWTQLIDVGALESKRLVATLNLSLNAVPFTRPQLFLDLTVAGVHQDRVEHIGTS
jgi:hypothetical protein